MTAGRKRAGAAPYWSSTTATPEERFGARVEPQPNGCWLYNGEPNTYELGHDTERGLWPAHSGCLG